MLRNFLLAVVLRKLIIVVVLLGVVFTGIDRVAVYLAQSAIQRRVAQDVGSDVQAHVHGFPFLLQVAHRELGDVTLSGDQVRLGSGIGVRRVTARLRDIDVHDVSDPVAGSLVLDGEVPFADVAVRLGVRPGALTALGSDHVRLVKSVPVARVLRQVSVVGAVRAVGGALVLSPTSVAVTGVALPPAALAVLKASLALRYPVAGLPARSLLESRGVSATGLLVRITAHDISLG